MFVKHRKAVGLFKILVIEVGKRVLGQVVDTRALAVAMVVNVCVEEDVSVSMSMSVVMKDCQEVVQLAVAGGALWP